MFADVFISVLNVLISYKKGFYSFSLNLNVFICFMFQYSTFLCVRNVLYK